MSDAKGAEDDAQLRELQDRLIIAVLPNIPFDGWSWAAIDAGALALDLDPADGPRCFPDGPRDAMAHFSDWADRQVLRVIDRTPAFAKMKVREKITFAVRTRLEILEPYKDAVRAMSARMARPTNATLAGRLVWRTADAMWYAAGDTATDFNHYTKRGLLSGVLTSTALFWLGDKSEGHEQSWAFLDRRIADVLAVGKQIGRFKSLGGRFPDPAKMARWSPFARRKADPAEGEPDTGPTLH